MYEYTYRDSQTVVPAGAGVSVYGVGRRSSKHSTLRPDAVVPSLRVAFVAVDRDWVLCSLARAGVAASVVGGAAVLHAR
eukprot:922307-Pleurochrysis_carterae.AAC.1